MSIFSPVLPPVLQHLKALLTTRKKLEGSATRVKETAAARLIPAVNNFYQLRLLALFDFIRLSLS